MERDVVQSIAQEPLSASSSDSGSYRESPETIHYEGVKPAEEGSLYNEAETGNCSRAEYLAGKDIQAIDWEVHDRSREAVRAGRLATYENYLNLPELFRDNIHRLRTRMNETAVGSDYYGFRSFKRHPKHSILHFQLRNLLWSTSAHDYYFLSKSSIQRYNSLNQAVEEELNLQNPETPICKIKDTVPVTTLCVSHGLLAAGGFYGEVVIKRLNGKVLFGENVSGSHMGLTNGLEFFKSRSGSLKLLASNNDNLVRMFDVEDPRQHRLFPVPWPANWTAASPDGGKLLAVVGDDRDTIIIDTATGEHVANLRGHLDYSFAAAWHPEGHLLATGNQDTTTRIWDMRMPDQAVHILLGRMAAIRSLRYSSCGRYLVAAEAADFVHVYDHYLEYTSEQEIDVFGEICGTAFTPDDSRLMISLQDDSYGGFLLHQKSIQ